MTKKLQPYSSNNKTDIHIAACILKTSFPTYQVLEKG